MQVTFLTVDVFYSRWKGRRPSYIKIEQLILYGKAEIEKVENAKLSQGICQSPPSEDFFS